MPDITEPEDHHEELPEGGEQTSPIDQRKLADEATKRRKELPLLQRIVKHFSKDRAVYRELVINAETLEKRVALLTNGVLDKFEIEHKGEKRRGGAVYKGRVPRVLPGMQAAFVDIGLDKAAFLYVGDVLFDPDVTRHQFDLTEGENDEDVDEVPEETEEVAPSSSDSGVTEAQAAPDRKSTRLNSSHLGTPYAVFCLKNHTQLSI